MSSAWYLQQGTATPSQARDMLVMMCFPAPSAGGRGQRACPARSSAGPGRHLASLVSAAAGPGRDGVPALLHRTPARRPAAPEAHTPHATHSRDTHNHGETSCRSLVAGTVAGEAAAAAPCRLHAPR